MISRKKCGSHFRKETTIEKNSFQYPIHTLSDKAFKGESDIVVEGHLK